MPYTLEPIHTTLLFRDTLMNYEHSAKALYAYYTTVYNNIDNATYAESLIDAKRINDIAIRSQISLFTRAAELCDDVITLDLALRVNYKYVHRAIAERIRKQFPHLCRHITFKVVACTDVPNIVMRLPMHHHQFGNMYLQCEKVTVPDLERRLSALRQMSMVKLTEADRILLEQWWKEYNDLINT